MEMNYIYKLKDGRAVLSPTDLAYACTGDMRHLRLDALRPEDESNIAIYADIQTAGIQQLAMDGSAWHDPAYAMAHAGDADVSFYRHYCLIQDGTIYVNDGGYKPLEEVMRTATKEEKEYILTQIATQAALGQLALTKIQATAQKQA